MPPTTRLSAKLTLEQDVPIQPIAYVMSSSSSSTPVEMLTPSWAVPRHRLKATKSKVNRFHFPVIHDVNLSLYNVNVLRKYGGGVKIVDTITKEEVTMADFLKQLNRDYATTRFCVVYCQRNTTSHFGADIDAFQVVERDYMPVFRKSHIDCCAVIKDGLLRMAGYQMLDADINWFTTVKK